MTCKTLIIAAAVAALGTTGAIAQTAKNPDAMAAHDAMAPRDAMATAPMVPDTMTKAQRKKHDAMMKHDAMKPDAMKLDAMKSATPQ